MELTAFTSRLGEGQGRLGPGVFVLGDDEPGRFFEFALGDRVEVSQAVDLTGVMLARSAVRLRVPERMPAGFAWEASLAVDGMKYASLRARPGRERIVTDLAANVSKLTGVHVVGVRLELVPG
ncbi:MAG: hypothetical protein Q8L48_25595 [Archangium sp.]|nr:hypothetical protein [Archangium sp.]